MNATTNLNPADLAALPTLMPNPVLLPLHVYEVRILNTRQGTVSGYYDDFAQLAIDAEQYDGRVPAIYTTLNPVNPALLARAQNRLVEYAKTTTSDACSSLWFAAARSLYSPSSFG